MISPSKGTTQHEDIMPRGRVSSRRMALDMPRLTQGITLIKGNSIIHLIRRLLDQATHPESAFSRSRTCIHSKTQQKQRKLTKRLILSDVAQILDPHDLICPVTIKPKYICTNSDCEDQLGRLIAIQGIIKMVTDAQRRSHTWPGSHSSLARYMKQLICRTPRLL